MNGNQVVEDLDGLCWELAVNKFMGERTIAQQKKLGEQMGLAS